MPCWLIFDAIATQVAMTCPRFPSTVVDNSPLTSPPPQKKQIRSTDDTSPAGLSGAWGVGRKDGA